MAENKLHTERVQLHRENVASTMRPIIWQQLIDRVRIAIDDQNTLADSCQAQLSNLKITFLLDPPGDSFQARNVYFPIGEAKAAFVGRRLIQISYSYQKSQLSDPLTWKEFLEFTVDDNYQTYATRNGEPITVDEAAMLILKPLKRVPGFNPMRTLG